MTFVVAILVLVLSVLSANAQTLVFNVPSIDKGWVSPGVGRITYSGDCKQMGDNGTSVPINLMQGSYPNLIFTTHVGYLDCAFPRSINEYSVADFLFGVYILKVDTTPEPSYSEPFEINTSKNVLVNGGRKIILGCVLGISGVIVAVFVWIMIRGCIKKKPNPQNNDIPLDPPKYESLSESNVYPSVPPYSSVQPARDSTNNNSNV